jgi:hypothetical protein
MVCWNDTEMNKVQIKYADFDKHGKIISQMVIGQKVISLPKEETCFVQKEKLNIGEMFCLETGLQQ